MNKVPGIGGSQEIVIHLQEGETDFLSKHYPLKKVHLHYVNATIEPTRHSRISSRIVSPLYHNLCDSCFLFII